MGPEGCTSTKSFFLVKELIITIIYDVTQNNMTHDISTRVISLKIILKI